MVCLPDGSGIGCAPHGPGGPAERCDGFDEDCDGEIDEGAQDGRCGVCAEFCDRTQQCAEDVGGFVDQAACLANCTSYAAQGEEGAWERLTDCFLSMPCSSLSRRSAGFVPLDEHCIRSLRCDGVDGNQDLDLGDGISESDLAWGVCEALATCDEPAHDHRAADERRLRCVGSPVTEAHHCLQAPALEAVHECVQGLDLQEGVCSDRALNTCSVFRMHAPEDPGCEGRARPKSLRLGVDQRMDLDTMVVGDVGGALAGADLSWNTAAQEDFFLLAAEQGSTMHGYDGWTHPPTFDSVCPEDLADLQFAIEGSAVFGENAWHQTVLIKTDLGAVFKVGNVRLEEPFRDHGRIRFDIALLTAPENADDYPPDPCPEGESTVGRYAEWSGKVNVHAAVGGLWAVDDNCSSGFGQNRLNYCRKFWPETSSTLRFDANTGGKTAELRPFMNAHCRVLAASVGTNQYTCCAPAL